MSEWSFTVPVQYRKECKKVVQESNVPQRKFAAVFPSEVGKLAVVTASTSGIGFEVALALAQARADVIVAGRRAADGHEALAKIRPLAPDALVRFEKLDLESLKSVADFASRLGMAGRPIDLLINNACTFALLKREVTADGFELHLASNFLSHFALTAHLLPLLRAGKQPRVVQLTSTGRHHGEIFLDDLQIETGYTPLKAYSQSKLAMLIFALELQRKSEERGWGLAGNSAQPVGARAAQLANATEVTGSMSWYRRALGFAPQQREGRVLQALLEASEGSDQQDQRGAKSLTDLIGPTVPEALDMRVLDPKMGRKLWDAATELTRVEWPAE
jgi:NAD(P)-dependent dehydrogenase (short-subunit alcohol dehydrogenase family)